MHKVFDLDGRRYRAEQIVGAGGISDGTESTPVLFTDLETGIQYSGHTSGIGMEPDVTELVAALRESLRTAGAESYDITFAAQHRPAVASALQQYLARSISLERAKDVIWSVIEDATATAGEFECASVDAPFWHAVWTAQHLLDHEHAADGTANRELKLASEYLAGTREIPPGLRALPPGSS